MFLLVVLPLVAVQGLHEILPLWRPKGAELVKREEGEHALARTLARSDVALLSLTSRPFLQGQVQTYAANTANQEGLRESLHRCIDCMYMFLQISNSAKGLLGTMGKVCCGSFSLFIKWKRQEFSGASIKKKRERGNLHAHKSTTGR